MKERKEKKKKSVSRYFDEDVEARSNKVKFGEVAKAPPHIPVKPKATLKLKPARGPKIKKLQPE